MKILITAVMALGIMLATAQTGFTTSQDAVFDERTAKVVDKWGKCVRTKWTGDEDPCAPPKAPEPPVVVAPEPAPEPEPKIIAKTEERTVYFDFDSSVVSETEGDKLRVLANLVNDAQSVSSVRMVGFTDQFGSSAYNQKLSQRRVDAVKAYLEPLLQKPITAGADFRALGKAQATEGCASIKRFSERVACMRTERRVEIELERTYQE